MTLVINGLSEDSAMVKVSSPFFVSYANPEAGDGVPAEVRVDEVLFGQ